MATDTDKRKMKKVVKIEQTIRRRIWKLKKNKMKARFQERVKELVNVDAPNLWNTIKNGMLQACDEVCRKKKSKRNHGNMWRWNEEVQKAILLKKVAYKKMCEN